MMFTCPPNAVVMAGRSLDLVAQAIREAQRWRARNGLPALDAYAKLLAAVTANATPVAVDGHADSPAAPVVEAEAMTTHEAAALLGVSDRTARRLAPELGARRVGRAWLLDRAAVLEHAEGATP